MFGRLMPKEEKFFDHFAHHAEICVKASTELLALVSETRNVERRLHAIEGFEKQGDKVTYHTIATLHKTFITPIDREDIHHLITTMDDMLDLMEDAAQTVSLYDISTITPEAIRLAELCLDCCVKIKEATEKMTNMKHSQDILDICEEIDRMESDADHVMHAALSRLFRDEPDVRTLIKLKALYEILEQVTDVAHDIANIIESIVVENA